MRYFRTHERLIRTVRQFRRRSPSYPGKKQGGESLFPDSLGRGTLDPVRPLLSVAISSGVVASSSTAPHDEESLLPGCAIGVMDALRAFTPTRCEGVLVHLDLARFRAVCGLVPRPRSDLCTLFHVHYPYQYGVAKLLWYPPVTSCHQSVSSA